MTRDEHRTIATFVRIAARLFELMALTVIAATTTLTALKLWST